MSTSVTKKSGGLSVAQRANRVRLADVDRQRFDTIVGFETDPGAKPELRLSDNLLKSAVYVLRGLHHKALRDAEQAGATQVALPSAEEALKEIVTDKLVRQRQRELVAQLLLTKQAALPVRLTDPGKLPKAEHIVFQHLVKNLAGGFDPGTAPAKMPQMPQLIWLGAPRATGESDQQALPDGRKN